MKKAVVLLSGGLDSSTCLYIAKREGYEIYVLSFYYGQRAIKELEAARSIAKMAGVVEHQEVNISSFLIKGSALTEDMPIPVDGVDPTKIPVTYVPGRNTIFLAMGLSKAEQVGAEALFIGVNSVDYSGYPDCRPEYIKAFQEVSQLGTAVGIGGRPIRIEAPLQNMTKADIVRTALKLEPRILELSRSCYKGGDTPCGECDSCRLREEAIQEVLGDGGKK